MAQPPFSLEQIYNFDDQFVQQILELNRFSIQDPLTNKLSATILMHNGNYLQESDQPYVRDTLFPILYLYNDKQLVDIANIIHIKDRDKVDRIKLIRLIIDKVGTFDQNNLDKFLFLNAGFGNTEIVKLSLDKGADIHARDDRALTNAAFGGHVQTVQLLLDNRANIHARNDYALSTAAENNHTETVKLLLDRGADIHAGNEYALSMAALIGYTEMVRLLLDRGADIHGGDDRALLNAASKRYTDIVILLLNRGANFDKLDNDSKMTYRYLLQ